MKCSKYIFILVLLFPLLAQAQIEGVAYEWKEQKNKKGISISTSSVEGSSFKAVRGEMVVKASAASLFALVDDVSACPDWAAMCKEARLEKRISDSESYVYIYNDIPFPVSDRDVYTHVVWTRDPKTNRISMTSTASADGTPKTKAVRIENAVSQWHFTSNGDGTTTVENFAHIDPNGPTPAWITNMMLVDAPYKTMLKMRKIVESGTYADVATPIDRL
jgi:ribosome-associated toxin RatA of RatAB toxin-antitoxin module